MVLLVVAYRDDLVQASLRVYERYAREVVERFGFCPWARSARESGSVALHVVFSVNQQDLDESITRLASLHAGPESTEIALLIYPLLDLDRLGFEDFVRRLRGRAEACDPALDAFAMAAFHPTASVDLAHPDRLVPFVRRSPDPTLQLVRKTALSGIKNLSSGTAFVDVSALSAEGMKALLEPSARPVRERIAEHNLDAVRAAGPERIEAILADIQREREQAHARLLQLYGQRGPRRT